MQKWKKIMLIIAAIVAVALIIVGIIQSSMNHNTSEKDNRVTLERLDSISKRLSDIWLELEKIDAEIAEREYQKDNLISEQTKLNDEASALFMSMMTPEMFEQKPEMFPEWHMDVEPTGCEGPYQEEFRLLADGYNTDVAVAIEHLKLLWCEDEALDIWNRFASYKCDWIWCDPNDWWEPGKLTEDWTNQVMPAVTWADSHQRFKDLAIAYGLDPSKIWEVENHYGITEGVVLCITIAETSWGKFGAGNWNIWNVGNNDRGDRVSFALADTGLEKIGQTLTNQFLSNKKTLWCLSNWHHCEEPTDNGKRYATSSPETSWAWEPNMVACLDTIYGQWTTDPSTFNIRR